MMDGLFAKSIQEDVETQKLRKVSRDEAIKFRAVERKQIESVEEDGDLEIKTSSSNSDNNNLTESEEEAKPPVVLTFDELRDRYQRIARDNVQLSDQKQILRYEVDLLKERMEELEDKQIELERLNRRLKEETCHLRHTSAELHSDNVHLRDQLTNISVAQGGFLHRDQSTLDDLGLVEALLSEETVRILRKLPQESLDGKISALARTRISETQVDNSNEVLATAAQENNTPNDRVTEVCLSLKETIVAYPTESTEPTLGEKLRNLVTKLDKFVRVRENDQPTGDHS